jgi:probable phosphoglycerate mutase
VNPRVVHLIRHGQSDLTSDDMIDGPRGRQYDPPLSETGRDQAERLARRLLLLDPRPAAVYASPLRRTRETVAPFAERAGIEVGYVDDLMEAYVGGWEGMRFEEIIASDEDILPLVRAGHAIWQRAPGGERFEEFRNRVNGAVDEILARHPEGDIVIVCHGGAINAALGPLLGIEHEMFFLPENTSVNSVEDDGASRRPRFLNDILHLTDPNLFD